MKTISIHDAKSNLSKYIAAAKKGDKIYIGGFGKPEVLLVKVSEKDKKYINTRNFKSAIGKVADYDDAFTDTTENQVYDLLLGNK